MSKIALESNHSAAEIGCWQSHLQIYFKIVEMKYTLPILIFEDDIIFRNDTIKHIHQYLTECPYFYWELFFIGYNTESRSINLNDMYCQLELIWGTHGYLIRNYEVAQKLIKYSNTPYKQEADTLLNSYLYTNESIGIIDCRYPLVDQYRYEFGSDIDPNYKKYQIRINNPIIEYNYTSNGLKERQLNRRNAEVPYGLQINRRINLMK
jgi:GR25 family glycosyltransferase involved in LPS biosynthesis